MIAKKRKKPATRRITLTRRELIAQANKVAHHGENLIKRAKKIRARAEKMPPNSHWNTRTSKVVKAPLFVAIKRTKSTPARLRQWAAACRKDASMLEARALKLEVKQPKAKR